MVVAMRRFGVSAPVAAVAALVAGLSPPLAIYGTQIYPELPGALVALAGFWWATGRLSKGAVWAGGLAVVALPWLSVKYTLVAAVLAAGLLWRLWRNDRSTWAIGLAGGLGAAATTFVLGHEWIYGGPTAYASGSHFVASEFSVMGDRPDYIGRTQRVVGLLVDRSFGLAVWQPAAKAIVPALAVMHRRRPRHGALLAALIAAGWLTATYLALTMQSWWWPARQTVIMVPLAVAAIAWWAERFGTVGRRVVLAAGLLVVAAYVFLVAGVLGGRHTLIVDFERTVDPFVRVARTVPARRHHAARPARGGGWRHGPPSSASWPCGRRGGIPHEVLSAAGWFDPGPRRRATGRWTRRARSAGSQRGASARGGAGARPG
jgi:hypothetical protein